MWTTHQDALPNDGLRFTVDVDSRRATFAEVLEGWRYDSSFRSLFNKLLADSPFSAFRWETPAATSATVLKPFECVVLDDPGLARAPDRAAFAEEFAKADNGVSVFANLGRDATLVVPSPLVDSSAYGHLAAFVRFAPEQQRHALWQSVGKAMSQRIGAKPVWLSTAGAGVSWLHIRLDDRPKYYGHSPYRLIG